MPAAPSRLLRTLGFLALQASLWVVLTLSFAMLIQAAGWAGWEDAFTFSATSWLPWIAIAPAVFWLSQRFPFERGRIWRSVPVHSVACMACIFVAVWISAQFTPLRRPFAAHGTPGTHRPADSMTVGNHLTAERPPLVELPPGSPGSTTATGTTAATEANTGDRRPARASSSPEWPAERPSSARRAWERVERAERSTPTTVPGTLRRWAFLSSIWPPFGSTMLRANFIAAVYVLIACAAHTLGYYRRAQERESQALALAAGLNRAKLDALRLQLQPHFLFNTLNAISALVHRNPSAADELITDLSELLRLSLKSADHEVPLSRELELLECYLSIEQTRLGDRLRVVREIDSSVTGAMVPTLILQPLAENAIRHGIEPRRTRGTLTITVRGDAERIRLVVADDGVGLKGPGASSARHGIGLTNAEQRLRALHGDQAQLNLISPEDGGVRVEISLPRRHTPVSVAPAPTVAEVA